MKKIIFLALCLMLTGCVTVKVPNQNPEEVHKSYGYVFMSGEGKVGIRDAKKEEDYYELLNIDTDSYDHAYGIWLPAGKYKLVGLGDGRPLLFEVKPGYVTDLGHFITFNLGGYKYVTIPYHDVTFQEVREKLFDESQYFSKAKYLRWNIKEVPEIQEQRESSTGLGLIADIMMAYDRKVNKPSIIKQLIDTKDPEEFLKFAKRIALIKNYKPTSDQNGNLYYASSYGQIRKRDTDGQWSSIDTGVLRDTLAVEFDGNQFVVAYNNGTFSVSEDLGATWKQYTSPIRDEIYAIERVDSGWVIASRTSYEYFRETDKQAIKLYLTKDFNEYELFQESDLGSTYLHFMSPLKVRSVGSKLYYHDGSGVTVHDFQTNKSMQLDLDFIVTGFNISEDHSTIVVYNGATFYSEVSISGDFLNYKKIAEPSTYVTNIYFDTLDDGEAVRIDQGLHISTLEFYKYNPKENSWEFITEAPEGCIHTLENDSGKVFLCMTRSGSILNHKNGEWYVEFSSE